MRSVKNALWPELTGKSLLSPHFAMPSRGINRDAIASRAELCPKYARSILYLPNMGQIQAYLPRLSSLAGVDILQKTHTNQICEHARSPV